MGGGASVHKKSADDGSEAQSQSNQKKNKLSHQSSSASTTSKSFSKSSIKSSWINRKSKGKTPKDTKTAISSHSPIKQRPSAMGKLERALKAAILIQRWYRQYLARLEIRRRYTWNIFQTIEYAGENDHQKMLYNFFNALLTHIPQKQLGTEAKESAKEEFGSMDSLSISSGVSGDGSQSSSSKNNKVKLRKRKIFSGNGPGIDLENIAVESDYKGPHVKFPVTQQTVQDLIDAFKKKKCLHVKYVAGILRLSATALRTRENFNHPSTALSKQITICGDLHGKLDDLFVILYKNGLPSAENPYVFNGDYVDRGKRSIEILLILLVCFLLCPEAVYLNRGNHEDHIMNMRYGFIREIRLKYKVFANRVLHLVDQVYRNIPLGSIIDNRVLVVHGGISASTDIAIIDKIDRHKYVSILRPPLVETMNDEGHIIQLAELYAGSNNNSEWKQVLDLLWSDPKNGIGCSPNTFRGGGSYFGSDVTEKVLEKHGFQLLIRSHECKADGYEYMHENKCLTVFSASNYYEEGSNKGAYVKLIGGPLEPLEPHFVQFNASTPKLRNMTIRQRIGLVEASAMRELKSRIKETTEQIKKEFEMLDENSIGLISLNDWCLALENGTNLKLPWRMLRTKLAQVDEPSGLIKYLTTFEDDAISNEGGETVAEILYRHKSNLETIFRIIDKDNSGYISMEEFSDACDLLSKHLSSPIPQKQMIEMAKSMDLNKDGNIDLNEFLETFRIVSTEQEALDMDEEEME